MSTPNTVNVSVVSRVQLVRQGIAQRLALLGATVDEYAEAAGALKSMANSVPDIFILDAEEPGLDWRVLVSELRQRHTSLLPVLFARALSVDDVASARDAGVATIILRPFREEEHMRRLAGLLRQARGARARRREPRFYPELESTSVVSLEADLSAMYGVVNLSMAGACLREPETELRVLPEGQAAAVIRLSTWGIRVGAQARVVWRRDKLLGLRYTVLTAGREDYHDHIDFLRHRTFGQWRIDGAW